MRFAFSTASIVLFFILRIYIMPACTYIPRYIIVYPIYLYYIKYNNNYRDDDDGDDDEARVGRFSLFLGLYIYIYVYYKRAKPK